MKTIIAVIGIVVVMGLAVYYKDSSPLPEYVKEQVTLEVTNSPEIPESSKDVITKAQEELERINAELDAKEQELLEERKAIDAELERLRQTRVSFQ